MFRIWALTAAAIAVHGAACASPITGPVSPLYFEGYGGISVLQGTQIVRTIPHAYTSGSHSEGAFAVSQTLRTRGSDRVFPGEIVPGRSNGGEYTLTGVPTGIGYGVPPSGTDRVYDGTTDGQNNYFTDHFRGEIYVTDYYWGNPRVLFNAEQDREDCPSNPNFGDRCGCNTGIAYDPYHNSLWIASRCDSIREFSSQGVRRIGGPGSGLAFDPADRTLWLSSGNGFQQWSTDGQLLQEIPGLSSDALEFQVVPEPSTSALCAGGLVVLALCGWRRTRSRKNGGDNSRG